MTMGLTLGLLLEKGAYPGDSIATRDWTADKLCRERTALPRLNARS